MKNIYDESAARPALSELDDVPAPDLPATRMSSPEDRPHPFLNFVCFDIPLVGFLFHAAMCTRQPNRSESAFSWALSGIKVRMALAFFVAALDLWVALKTGQLDLAAQAGAIKALNLFLQSLCDGFKLEALFL